MVWQIEILTKEIAAVKAIIQEDLVSRRPNNLPLLGCASLSGRRFGSPQDDKVKLRCYYTAIERKEQKEKETRCVTLGLESTCSHLKPSLP